MRVELLVVVVLGCLLAVLIVASPSHSRPKATRIVCVTNLRNIGLAFRVFAMDNNGHHPMSLSFTNGGTREWVDNPVKVWLHYLSLSNEISVPRVLVCPTDREGRIQATYFPSNLAVAATYQPRKNDQAIPLSRNQNVSYFIGLAATETKPEMLLAGDRNLTNGEPARFEYGKARIGNLGANHLNQPGIPGVGWDRNVHNCAGNVVNADGSVQQYTSSQLRDALRNSGDTENRIATPD